MNAVMHLANPRAQTGDSAKKRGCSPHKRHASGQERTPNANVGLASQISPRVRQPAGACIFTNAIAICQVLQSKVETKTKGNDCGCVS